jgi:hypothetical protein
MPNEQDTMDKPWLERGWLLLGYIFISTFLGWLLAILVGQKVFLPIITALLIYPIFANRVMQGRLGAAAGWAMVWALAMTVAGILFTILWPRLFTGEWAGRVDAAVERGGDYTKSMFVWIATGVGAESDPSRFIPVHLRNLGMFSLASIISGGALGLAFGAVQLNLMNFYVGMFTAYSHQPLLAAFLAWPPYAVMRVVGYILLATGFSTPAICWATKKCIPWKKAWRFFGMGLALVLLDILLKWLVAPLWREILIGLAPTFAGGIS